MLRACGHGAVDRCAVGLRLRGERNVADEEAGGAGGVYGGFRSRSHSRRDGAPEAAGSEAVGTRRRRAAGPAGAVRGAGGAAAAGGRRDGRGDARGAGLQRLRGREREQRPPQDARHLRRLPTLRVISADPYTCLFD